MNGFRHEQDFRAYARFEITFAEFYRRTTRLWFALARQMRRRWPQPSWVTIEDTVNDILLTAADLIKPPIPRVPQFDETRSTSLQRWVIYNAYDKAKKRGHKTRNASHARAKGEKDNPDRARSRIERPLSSFGEEGGDEGDHASVVERTCFSAGVYTSPEQEDALLGEEDRKDVAQKVWMMAESFEEMDALAALSEARSIPEAAVLLYSDRSIRRSLSLESRAHAEEVVRRVVRTVAVRLRTA
jgi:hypothetical protein